MYNYSKATYNSPNPLRRFSHRTRFKKSYSLIDLKKDELLLDYGCGDGHFLEQLQQNFSPQNLIGYEPDSSAYIYNNTKVTNKIAELFDKNMKFDKISCFEVLEHCKQQTQQDILNNLSELLEKEGRVVISVPIEIGIVALIKNLMRFRLNSSRRFDGYNFKNILYSLFGLPLTEYRNSKESLSHMGFYYTDLETLILEKFIIEKKIMSPFSFFNQWCNSQVFYVLKNRF
jgi:SAM-dependent methyltransferase